MRRCVWSRKTSWMRSWPALGRSATAKKKWMWSLFRRSEIEQILATETRRVLSSRSDRFTPVNEHFHLAFRQVVRKAPHNYCWTPAPKVAELWHHCAVVGRPLVWIPAQKLSQIQFRQVPASMAGLPYIIPRPFTSHLFCPMSQKNVFVEATANTRFYAIHVFYITHYYVRLKACYESVGPRNNFPSL